MARGLDPKSIRQLLFAVVMWLVSGFGQRVPLPAPARSIKSPEGVTETKSPSAPPGTRMPRVFLGAEPRGWCLCGGRINTLFDYLFHVSCDSCSYKGEIQKKNGVHLYGAVKGHGDP
jgi:hypothetical protein